MRKKLFMLLLSLEKYHQQSNANCKKKTVHAAFITLKNTTNTVMLTMRKKTVHVAFITLKNTINPVMLTMKKKHCSCCFYPLKNTTNKVMLTTRKKLFMLFLSFEKYNQPSNANYEKKIVHAALII